MKKLRPIHYIVIGAILGLVGVILILSNVGGETNINPSFLLGVLSGVSSVISIIKGIVEIALLQREKKSITTEPSQYMERSPDGKQIQEYSSSGSQKMVDSKGGLQRIGKRKKQKKSKRN